MPAVTLNKSLPRGALMGVWGLAAAAFLLVCYARLSGYRPDGPPPSTVVEQHDLRFEDGANGAVLIYSSSDNRLVDTLPPGSGGFVRGVLRGLARERRADGIGAAAPLRLTRWADGRLSLDDPSTGRHVDLEVFGPTNAGDFAAILIASGQKKDQT